MAGCAAASKLTDGLKRLSQSHAHRNARLLRLKCQWRKDVLDADRADSEVLVLAHRLIGACQLYLGNFGETRRHCEAGLRLGAHWRWHAARGPAGSSCATPAISPISWRRRATGLAGSIGSRTSTAASPRGRESVAEGKR